MDAHAQLGICPSAQVHGFFRWKVIARAGIHRRGSLEISRKITILLPILTKRIIVEPHGEIIDYQLNSPVFYLRSPIRNVSTPGKGEGSSEHVPLGG